MSETFISRTALAWRPLRFALAGGANTIFGYLSFAVLLWIGFGASMALAISTCMGILFNFAIAGRVVFGSRDVRRLPRFVLVYVALFILNLIALNGLIALGVGASLAQAGLVLPFAAASYLMQRDLVFCAPHDEPRP